MCINFIHHGEAFCNKILKNLVFLYLAYTLCTSTAKHISATRRAANGIRYYTMIMVERFYGKIR